MLGLVVLLLLSLPWPLAAPSAGGAPALLVALKAAAWGDSMLLMLL
jgi:hypothetical protein